VGAGEEDKVVFAGAVDLAVRVEGVARDDERGQVAGAAALTGDTTGVRAFETELLCEGAGGCLFYNGEGW
jgi:hypothetical protein